MSEGKLPTMAEREWYEEEERHLDATKRWLQRWPNFRQSAAYALLGSAIAFADMMGCDVEAFVRQLRDKGCTQRDSGVLVPPSGS